MKKLWIWNHDATYMFRNRSGRHYWFAKYIRAYGFEPVVFCASTNHFDGTQMDFKGNYRVDTVDGIPFVFVKTPAYKGNGGKRIWNWMCFYRGLFRIYRSVAARFGKPDVILASSVHPLTMAAGVQIGKRLGIPCSCEVRDLWPEAIFQAGMARERSFLGRALILGEHWIYRNADAMIFTKEGDTDYLGERGWLTEQGGDIDIRQCFYINNGIDLQEYVKQIREKRLEDPDLSSDAFRVTYVGTLRKVNHLELLIRAAVLLKEETDIEFLIYGAGEEEEALKRLIRENGLERVHMKGYVNGQFVPYILSCSSVNLLNYSQHMYNWSRGNSSRKLFEYMASGKPVISTVAMKYSPIEKYRCGISMESGSAEELADCIRRIKGMGAEERERMGRNARAGAGDFDASVLTGKLADVIEYAQREWKKKQS